MVCLLCQGVGWKVETHWKLKCVLCDVNGFMDSEEALDYFTHIDPCEDKVEEIRSRLAQGEKGSSAHSYTN